MWCTRQKTRKSKINPENGSYPPNIKKEVNITELNTLRAITMISWKIILYYNMLLAKSIILDITMQKSNLFIWISIRSKRDIRFMYGFSTAVELRNKRNILFAFRILQLQHEPAGANCNILTSKSWTFGWYKVLLLIILTYLRRLSF